MQNLTAESDADRPREPRKINECFADTRYYCSPGPLFDEFWRVGDLALLFGPAGAGKSLLAVQIGDALARGRGLEGFQMGFGRRRVLYVDLNLSDRQFQARYTYFAPNRFDRKSYKFAGNLYRDRPPADQDLCTWLAASVSEHRFDVVIIDDL